MPEARISPKVIFIGRVRAGMAHDSANRVSREAARFGVPESVTMLGAPLFWTPLGDFKASVGSRRRYVMNYFCS
jgi:hypothetical protein